MTFVVMLRLALSCNYAKKSRVNKGTNPKYSLLVVKVNVSGLSNSKPCRVCTQLIKRSRVKTVYYSDDAGNIVKTKPEMLTEDYVSKGMSRIDIVHICATYLIKKMRRYEIYHKSGT